MKKCICMVGIVLAALGTVKADSPITSVNPAMAYADILLVNQELAAAEHTLSAEECEFLFSAANPLDQKFAFINALGWGDSTHVETYAAFLAKKYSLSRAVFDSVLTWRGNQPGAYAPAAALTADDYACLAYLQASGDYFRPLKGYYCAYRAADLKPGSEAASYIYGLIMAQFLLDNDWCKLYEVMVSVRDFDAYTVDRIHPDAIKDIFEYIDLYRNACDEAAKTHPDSPTGMAEGGAYYNKPLYPQKMEGKKNYADLEVVKIEYPEYDEASKGAKVVVTVKNRGTISSIETNAAMRDLDITAAEARKRKFPKHWIKVIEHANAQSKTPDPGAPAEWIMPGIDYDKNWEVFTRIPVLQPGEEVQIIFILPNHWVYDPNCEIEVELDQDQNIEEKNEANNKMAFVAWG